jgi:hypothetical protein
MTSPSTSARPIPAYACPLCGGANECGAAASGSFDGPCWCTAATFSGELLARVPVEAQGRACICRRCAALDAATRTLPPIDPD